MDINSELMRLGLSWAEEDDFKMYFQEVMYSIIQECKLTSYYKMYRDGRAVEPLFFMTTFQKSENDRKAFCQCIGLMEIDFFFAGEIQDYYGTKDKIPVDIPTGKPILAVEGIPHFEDLLNHPKRHMIESMLIDGQTPKMIADYLDRTYDIDLDPKDIAFFANAFFKTKRRDLERTIDDMQMEVGKLEESLTLLRDMDESKMSIGERTTAMAATKVQMAQMNDQIKRLTGSHSHAAYNAGVLEFAHMREAFADVFRRSQRRFNKMDKRTEDSVVDSLAKIVGMMSKSTERILGLDEKMSATTKKTISEEMLDVVVPSLERVLEEEQQAFLEFQKEFGGTAQKDDFDAETTEILGIDD